MIKNNFYSTVTTWNILPESMEFTAYVPNIPITERPAPNAYWLGWISIDNLPQGLHVSEIRLNNNGYEFIDITPQENFDCGYSFRVPPTYTYISDRPIRISYYRESISKWSATAGTANSNNFCFANKANVMAISNGSVDLYCSYVIYNSTGESIVARNLSSSSMFFASFTHAEWISFLNGSPLTFSANNATVEITKSDLETGTFYKEMSDGTFIRFFLVGYNFIPNRTTYLSGSSWYDRPSSTPAFMVHINTEYYGDAIVTGCDTTQSTVLQWQNNNPAAVLDKVVLRGCKGYFSFETISNLNYNVSPYAWNETTLIFRQDSNAVNWVQAIFPISEIEKHYNLNIRSSAIEATQRPYYGYTENVVYAPYVTEDNEFTATRITGNLVDDEFKSKLRLWQYDATEWAENDYTEDKKPEYNPGGDEDPFGGANWLTNSFPYGGTDGFVTQYVLTESQLQSFGANLWAKFFTQDFWESICVILPESLSINASDILNYVVSLREYPFDVTVVGNCASDDPIIFIGRGIVGVTVTGSSIYRMLEYNGHISIESNTIEPYFGDFRDYEPCTRITLFVPFCGVVELTPSQVIGGTITLRYSIDFSTGAIQCTVQVNRGAFTTNLNTLSGSVGANVQMSASNLTQVLQKGAGMVANFSKSASMFAIGMGEVGMAEGAIASAESEQEIANAVGKFQSGVTKTQSAFSIPDLNGVPVPVFGQSGGFASFQITEPMIQRTYHYYELPSNYAHVYGYACNKTVTLSTLENKGFTVCKNVDLSGIPATQDELSAIESLLTSGVYF